MTAHRDSMVEALERYLIEHWLVNIVATSLPGARRPRRVNGKVPDIEGVTSLIGQSVFGAAEECDTYAMKDSRERLEALSRGRSSAVFLIVPAECYGPAKVHVQDALPNRNITVVPFARDSVPAFENKGYPY